MTKNKVGIAIFSAILFSLFLIRLLLIFGCCFESQEMLFGIIDVSYVALTYVFFRKIGINSIPLNAFHAIAYLLFFHFQIIPMDFRKFGFIFGLCVIGFWIVYFIKLLKYTSSSNQENNRLEKTIIEWILNPMNSRAVIKFQCLTILVLIFACVFFHAKANRLESFERKFSLQKEDMDFYEGILVNLHADMSDFEQQAIDIQMPMDRIKNSSEIIHINSRLLVFENGKLSRSLSRRMDKEEISVFANTKN